MPSRYWDKLFQNSVPPPGLRIVHVYRDDWVQDGPHIRTISAGRWCPPQIGKIEEKLRCKKYRAEAPLELFAYSRHDEPDGAVTWRKEIDACVHAHLPGSLFRRVHIFNLAFLQHIYTYQPILNQPA